MAILIDGKAVAAEIRGNIRDAVAKLRAENDLQPGLAVVLVGTDPASEVYVRNKGKQTIEAGMQSFEHKFDSDTDEATILALIERLNADDKVHGILVQLPLPPQIDADKVINAIDPDKDVDGFHVINAGRLATGQKCLVPCTPAGCVILARRALGDLSGLDAVIVGRSKIVGKPLVQLLLNENCTVTVAHSRTRDLDEKCRRADLLVAAVGRPEMIPGDWVKPGACVIDVGINRIAGEGKTRLVGDVEFASAEKIAGSITPVPGGVGPMTIALLLANTVAAACAIHGVEAPDLYK